MPQIIRTIKTLRGNRLDFSNVLEADPNLHEASLMIGYSSAMVRVEDEMGQATVEADVM